MALPDIVGDVLKTAINSNVGQQLVTAGANRAAAEIYDATGFVTEEVGSPTASVAAGGGGLIGDIDKSQNRGELAYDSKGNSYLPGTMPPEKKQKLLIGAAVIGVFLLIEFMKFTRSEKGRK
ncbi:MAG: hypothetical protein JXR40_03890 [Pontiellaceae bacterium]|nr:hypothetical protein [Pontiellaceae bacterium]